MSAINKKTWLQSEDVFAGRVGVCCGVICSPYCKQVQT